MIMLIMSVVMAKDEEGLHEISRKPKRIVRKKMARVCHRFVNEIIAK